MEGTLRIDEKEMYYYIDDLGNVEEVSIIGLIWGSGKYIVKTKKGFQEVVR